MEGGRRGGTMRRSKVGSEEQVMLRNTSPRKSVVQVVQRLGHKITRRRGDVKERGTVTGYRWFSAWAIKSPGGEVI